MNALIVEGLFEGQIHEADEAIDEGGIHSLEVGVHLLEEIPLVFEVWRFDWCVVNRNDCN